MPRTSTYTRDTSTSIASDHRGLCPVVAGMFIGRMGYLSTEQLRSSKIRAVLTVATIAGTVPDEVSHRHLPLSWQMPDPDQLDVAVHWVLDQIWAERCVLVRSEGGLQRPALVVAAAVLQMGGWYSDALTAVHKANPEALTDIRYLDLLRERDEQNRARPVTRA